MIIDGACGQLPGPREVQNDAFRVHEHAVFVADGVGDSLDTHQVAELACESAVAVPRDGGLLDALLDLPVQVGRTARARGLVGSTTLTGVVLDDDLLWLVSVGDSRGYVLTEAGVVATQPHNDYHERLALDPADDQGGRHVLTRSMGREPHPIDVRPIRVVPGDVVVLASDGVEALLTPRELLDTVAARLRLGEDPRTAVLEILERCEALGLVDNTTVGVFLIRPAAPPGQQPT